MYYMYVYINTYACVCVHVCLKSADTKSRALDNFLFLTYPIT